MAQKIATVPMYDLKRSLFPVELLLDWSPVKTIYYLKEEERRKGRQNESGRNTKIQLMLSHNERLRLSAYTVTFHYCFRSCIL
jgi:hypothetical protein